MNQEICTVEIARGRLSLRAIEMCMTYGGMLEGVPCRSMNERLVERALARAGTPAHLVPPPVTPLSHQALPERWGPAEALPSVECVGFFTGPPTPRAADDWWRTVLHVVWYQDPSGHVVHPDAAARMHDLPWDEIAQDLTFDDC
ncbi:hypothetical protein ACSNOI_34350 [Actinomadura kijaniata]|uniref:hypothetical protein n=1 Tax=Actinomadura kijaniata TaxID=46161 RepID=UPI003F193CD9